MKPRDSLLALLHGGVVLWLALTLVFVTLRVLPGDAVTATFRDTTDTEMNARRAALGLDDHWLTQYARYLGDLLRGDLGHSLTSSESVGQMILSRLGPTLALGLAAFGIMTALGITLGIFSALESPHWLRHLSNNLIVLAQAVPFYVTALLLIHIFTRQFAILPAFGSRTPLHLILPAFTLGFHTAGGVAQVLSINLRDTFRQPYMLTARAKGLPPIDLLDHALRVALLPTLSAIALQAGFLLSGTVVIEVLFVRRGLGNLLFQSVLNRDYPVVQALALLSALIYLSANGFSGIARRLLDPRLR